MSVEKAQPVEQLSPEEIKRLEREDAMYSAGEFFDETSIKQHYQRVIGESIKKDVKRRKKTAQREQHRLGGPIKLWTFKDIKEGRKHMSANMVEKEMDEQDEMDEPEMDEAEEQEEKKPKKAKPAKKIEKTKKPVKEKKEKKDTKEKKGKKVKKEKKDRKSRGPRVVDGKITLIEKENPKRKGSSAYKRYELYKKHKTVAGYLDAGGKRSSLRYDEKHGYIKLSGIKTTDDVKKEKE